MPDLKLGDVFGKMMEAAGDAFGDGWESIKNYAPAEFRKMGVQLVDIAKNVELYAQDRDTGYSPQTAKLLLRMQRNSTEAVLVAVSTLTLLTVQRSINAVLKVLKETFQ